MSETSVDTAPASSGFVLPGWDDEPTPEPASESRSGRVGSLLSKLREDHGWVLWFAAGLVVLIGAALVFAGVKNRNVDLEAPLPERDIEVSADAPVRGPDGKNDRVGTDVGRMSLSEMGNQRYFIPALGAYSYIYPMDGFTPSRYKGFNSLDLPANPADSSWYSQGGALGDNTPGTEGTTLLASHVSGQGKWGALARLHSLKGGELVYVTDSVGNLSVWKVTRVFTRLHTSFPEEFFAADGPRRLVLTTCGAYDSQTRSNTKNIFAVAEPVDPLTWQPFVVDELDGEEAPAEADGKSDGATREKSTSAQKKTSRKSSKTE